MLRYEGTLGHGEPKLISLDYKDPQGQDLSLCSYREAACNLYGQTQFDWTIWIANEIVLISCSDYKGQSIFSTEHLAVMGISKKSDWPK